MGTTEKGIHFWKYRCLAERQLLLILSARCLGPTVMQRSVKPEKDRWRSASGSTSSIYLGFNQSRSDHSTVWGFFSLLKLDADFQLLLLSLSYSPMALTSTHFIDFPTACEAIVVRLMSKQRTEIICQLWNGDGQRGERRKRVAVPSELLFLYLPFL